MYFPLDANNREIRLVTIQPGTTQEPARCTLETVSLNDSPIYLALSYVWGDPTITIPIVLDDRPFDVTANLAFALDFIIPPHLSGVPFWIDAICINQADLEERASQVGLMKDIYQTADTVISWLGQKDWWVTAAQSFLGSAERQGFSWDWFRKVLFEDEDGKLPGGLWALKTCLWTHERDYWRRLWIAQEISFAQHGYLQFEDCVLPYDSIKKFAAAFSLEQMELEACVEELLTKKSGEDDIGLFLLELKDSLRVFAENEIVRGVEPDEPMLELLALYRWKQASDPRDKVFGLLGLSNLPSDCHPGLAISYKKKAEDVYIGVVKALVEIDSTLDVLCHCYASSNHGNVKLDLPSWTPDWSIQRNRVYHKLEDRSVNNSARDSPACVDFLENRILRVTGFRLGLIKRCGSAIPDGSAGDGALENSSKVLLPVWEGWQKAVQHAFGDPSRWEKHFFRTLSCGRYDNDETLTFAIETFKAYQRDFADIPSHLISTMKMVGETWFSQDWRDGSDNVLFTIESIISSEEREGATIPLVGISMDDLQDGDTLCIFLGCPQPVIIRPDGDQFRIVAAAYVDLLAAGQAMDDLESGFYDLETFDLK